MALVETIKLGSSSFVIQQGHYDLTADSLKLRCQKPIHAGDDYTFEFTLVDEDESPVDITGWTLTFCVKASLSDASLTASVAATIIDASEGRFDVVISDSTFTNTTQFTGMYEIQAVDNSGDRCSLIHGCIQVLPIICP